MEKYISERLNFYRQRMHLLIHVFNRPFPVPYYFLTMISSRNASKVEVADLGSGPICTLGNLWDHREVKIVPSDILQPHYQKMFDDAGVNLLIPTEYQDMEHLTYPDESFDIVHVVNSLDHIRDAKQALDEAVRICRPGGYIYLRHAEAQKRRWGKHHYWNANPNGSFSNNEVRFYLEGFRTYYDGNYVISTMRKTP